MLDQLDEYRRMADNEQELWWYRSLHRLCSSTIETVLDNRRISILDAGCGTGGLLLHLNKQGYKNVMGFDLSDTAVALCRERNLNVFREDIRNLRSLFSRQAFDVIVSNDTLYYLTPSEWQTFFSDCYRLLQPGGLVICNLPALRAFAGTHDIAVGISHRFSRSDIPKLFHLDQFHVLRENYWPFALSPLIFTARALQRARIGANLVGGIKSDVELPPAWLNGLFLAIGNTENAILPRKPFASSLFLASQRR